MLYFSLFCLNLVYVNVYVPKSGRGDVPKSDVYKYSDPGERRGDRLKNGGGGAGRAALMGTRGRPDEFPACKPRRPD